MKKSQMNFWNLIKTTKMKKISREFNRFQLAEERLKAVD